MVCHGVFGGRDTAGRLLLGTAVGRLFVLGNHVLCAVGTTATAGLALLRVAAATLVLTATAAGLRSRLRQWKPDGSDEVRQQRDAGAEPTPQRSPDRFAEGERHTVQRYESQRDRPPSCTG